MKKLNDAVIMQLENLIPADQMSRARIAREYISGGNSLPINGDFRIKDFSSAYANPWVMGLGEAQLIIGGDRLEGVFPRGQSSRWKSLDTGGSEKRLAVDPAEGILQLVSKMFSEPEPPPGIGRSYPSAGSMYSVQVFVLIPVGDHWKSLHLLPVTSEFEILHTPSWEEVRMSIGEAPWLDLARVDFILAYGILPALCLAKYGPRGYKFALLEVGEMIQHGLGEGQRENFASRPYGAYDEHSVGNLWGLEPSQCWIECLQVFSKVAENA